MNSKLQLKLAISIVTFSAFVMPETEVRSEPGKEKGQFHNPNYPERIDERHNQQRELPDAPNQDDQKIPSLDEDQIYELQNQKQQQKSEPENSSTDRNHVVDTATETYLDSQTTQTASSDADSNDDECVIEKVSQNSGEDAEEKARNEWDRPDRLPTTRATVGLPTLGEDGMAYNSGGWQRVKDNTYPRGAAGVGTLLAPSKKYKTKYASNKGLEGAPEWVKNFVNSSSIHNYYNHYLLVPININLKKTKDAFDNVNISISSDPTSNPPFNSRDVAFSCDGQFKRDCSIKGSDLLNNTGPYGNSGSARNEATKTIYAVFGFMSSDIENSSKDPDKKGSVNQKMGVFHENLNIEIKDELTGKKQTKKLSTGFLYKDAQNRSEGLVSEAFDDYNKGMFIESSMLSGSSPNPAAIPFSQKEISRETVRRVFAARGSSEANCPLSKLSVVDAQLAWKLASKNMLGKERDIIAKSYSVAFTKKKDLDDEGDGSGENNDAQGDSDEGGDDTQGDGEDSAPNNNGASNIPGAPDTREEAEEVEGDASSNEQESKSTEEALQNIPFTER